MKEKEMYTFEELCRNLEISMSQFCKRSSTDAGTIARIRQGEFTRISTANRLLRAFSEIYGRELSLDNVEGLNLQNPVIEKPARPRTSKKVADNAPTIEVSQICHTTQKVEVQTEIPDHLPHGTIKLADFAERHCIRKERIRDWVRDGIKGEKIETTLEMVKRANGGSQTHFLTPEQQEKALDFLRKHGKLKEPVAEEPAWYEPNGE